MLVIKADGQMEGQPGVIGGMKWTGEEIVVKKLYSSKPNQERFIHDDLIKKKKKDSFFGGRGNEAHSTMFRGY